MITSNSRLGLLTAVQGREVKSCLTDTGLLFSTISDDAPSFDEFFPDLKPLIGTVDFTKLPHRRSLKYEGNFNWKTMSASQL